MVPASANGKLALVRGSGQKSMVGVRRKGTSLLNGFLPIQHETNKPAEQQLDLFGGCRIDNSTLDILTAKVGCALERVSETRAEHDNKRQLRGIRKRGHMRWLLLSFSRRRGRASRGRRWRFELGFWVSFLLVLSTLDVDVTLRYRSFVCALGRGGQRRI
jgi:hypothetical protein